MEEDKKFIDVEGLIRSKNPKLLKWTPNFLLNYLKRIVHEDNINEFLITNKDKNGKEFCDAVLAKFNIQLDVKGLENIPKEGGAIFVVNHPLGGMDAMALVKVVDKVRKDIRFIVNDLLLSLKPLKNLFVGVNKHGRSSAQSMQEVSDLFDSDKAVFLFPAGLVSRKTNGVVKDLEWKKTFVTRAKKHNKKVIPVFLDGELTNFFYRLSNFRSKIGIKANLEMLYLADEMYKQENKRIKIIFGEPIEPTFFDKTKNDKQWANWVKDKVYAMQHEK